MMIDMTYKQIVRKITESTCIIIFFKKNGDLRCMLGTRNTAMAADIAGFFSSKIQEYDNRHTEKTGSIAVIDLEKKEMRAFRIEYVVEIIDLGDIRDDGVYDGAMADIYNYRAKYEEAVREHMFDIVESDVESND